MITNSSEYSKIHLFIHNKYGKANFCELKDSTCKGRFEWSNKTGNYLNNRRDWQQLCKSHHIRYDNKSPKRRNEKDINSKERSFGFMINENLRKSVINYCIKEGLLIKKFVANALTHELERKKYYESKKRNEL